MPQKGFIILRRRVDYSTFRIRTVVRSQPFHGDRSHRWVPPMGPVLFSKESKKEKPLSLLFLSQIHR